MSRERLIEVAFYGLLVGMLFWAPLRDASALALLFLLLSEPTASKGPASGPLPRAWSWPVGAFLAANVVSAAASVDPKSAFAALRFYPLGLLVFLGARRSIAAGGGQRLAAVLVAILGTFLLDGISQLLIGQSWLRASIPMWGRLQGALVYPSDVSLLVFLLPIASITLFGREAWKLAAGVLLVALVGAAVSVSGTRTAFGALVLFGLAAGWIHGLLRISVAMVAVATAVVITTASIGPATVVRRMVSEKTYKAENRSPQWKAATALFREAPILGHGPHSFRDIVKARHHERQFRRVWLKYAPYPHNIYLEALCGTGVFGLAALLWLLAAGVRHLYRRRAEPLARAALTSLVAFAAVGVFDLSLVKDWVQLSFWLPLGIAAGLSAGGYASPLTSSGAAEPTSPPLPH